MRNKEGAFVVDQVKYRQERERKEAAANKTALDELKALLMERTSPPTPSEPETAPPPTASTPVRRAHFADTPVSDASKAQRTAMEEALGHLFSDRE